MEQPQRRGGEDHLGRRWLGILVLAIVAGGIAFGIAATRVWWLLPLASAQGALVDRIFYTILAVTATAFVVMHVWLALSLMRSRRRGEVGAIAAPGPFRPAWMAGPALVVGGGVLLLCVLEVVLLTLSEADWAKIYSATPDAAAPVEIVGRQFFWYVRYPGPDGRLGRTNPRWVSPDNPLGIDPRDPAGKDNIVVVNELHLVVDRPVRVTVGSLDVIHSFFLPNFRVKQDAVPGHPVEIWFTPNREGTYQIECSQLCGVGHYTMRGNVTVESQAAFARWMRTQGRP
ncbi:MAG TPA: cytochrome-c oxidase [bacterium]|nr:cytochrome-c oxidase [bacterium]